MVELAKSGKTVCRLKGGDPFVFGRGGEEAQELKKHNVPFEIVPGITSAIAVPAYAGIPITHRDVVSCFPVVTGHEDPTKKETFLDYAQLAKAPGTLVFLMGIKQLPQISEQLILNGKSAETPVAIISWGTRPKQQTLVGNLQNIAQKVLEAQFKPPCIIIIGEVINYREEINWFEQLPLFGKTVLVTRAREQASELRQQLEQLGANVVECPAIKIIPTVADEPMKQTLKQISAFDWLILTSPNGVNLLFKQLDELGLDARSLNGVKVAAIGVATADTLKQFGIKADLMPPAYVAESLFETLQQEEKDLSGKRFLLARADIARDFLPEALERAGAIVKEMTLYNTIADEQDQAELIETLKSVQPDWVTFTSSSTVLHFSQRVATLLAEQPDYFKDTQFAAIGPVTATSFKNTYGRVDVVAETHTIPGLIEALINANTKAPQLAAS